MLPPPITSSPPPHLPFPQPREANLREGPNERTFRSSKFLVIGHRGCGMNILHSPDPRFKFIKENSIPSFDAATRLSVDFIEFDVQVTKDGCPVIFHDCLILTEEKGSIVEKRVTDLMLDEFLSYGPQDNPGKMGKPLFRRTIDGEIFEWKVENDAPLCTLQETFEKVEHSVGFNIELKFDDLIIYKEEQLSQMLQQVLQVVEKNAMVRPIIFSSFIPDAAQLVKKLQSTYPVFFLTNGGSKIYPDIRRNSLEEAINVCMMGGLNGIVAEVTSILRNPAAVDKIRNAGLSLITYGQLNNLPEVVYVQRLLAVEGVIVDLVQEITGAVSDIISSEQEEGSHEQQMNMKARTKPDYSQQRACFLMNGEQVCSQNTSLSSHIDNIIQFYRCK
ncbi:glycerophosphodiester phosphodiesterase GDPD1, chloroplastic-like isoform X2 [Benincasa hispida]|uniref:glycerophosphodiester phosphodiesterase GDPD1, chloroplastic-like isoform X2 n=1 Tax=Benincasa hispida TaxID=102211 RepID=UPI00190126CC|nr:glycerophosphodiester phosphodiesterase GDPD1, chloroplastic-like isoform X2 [Benincasa hispida]